MPPEYEAKIDHPVQPGWLLRGRDIYDDRQHIEALTERFEGSTESIEALLGATALAAIKTDAQRMSHESQSRGELRLHVNNRQIEYSSLAGRPQLVGKFIDWFSEVAMDCFNHDDTRRDLKEIGLDLGGMRQAGDWSGTKPIDAMAESINTALKLANPTATIEIVKRGKHLRKSYKAEPLDHFQHGQYNPNFSYAYVTRKRNAANIGIPGRFPMRVWKVSHAVIAINQLDEKEIAVIRESFEDIRNLEANRLKDSRPAGVMGRAFERDIASPLRPNVLTSIPLSAYYYVTMERIAA